jgi:pyruvate dehydrogenase phosphatase
MSVEVIRKAYQATEEGFLGVVTKQWPINPQIASVGSCCLVGVICGGSLYIANLGDSRAVLGRVVRATGEVLAIQLSPEHNVAIESVRQEMQSLHPDDPKIVVLKHNVWRVKGLIQVSSIPIAIFHLQGIWNLIFPNSSGLFFSSWKLKHFFAVLSMLNHIFCA